MKKKLEIKISEKGLKKFTQIEEECLKDHNGPLAVSPKAPTSKKNKRSKLRVLIIANNMN